MSRNPLHVVIHIDGGSRGNPGPAGAGVAIRDKADNSILYKGGVFLGNATNNVAEYSGLLAGLNAARDLNADRVELFSDSQLLVRQMTGEYRVKNAGLKPLHRRATDLADGFDICVCHARHEHQSERHSERQQTLFPHDRPPSKFMRGPR